MTSTIDASASTIQQKLVWAVDGLKIEIPSWGFMNTGTRFRVWQHPGTPRTVEEKIDDAATVHRYTGIARTVALHIPWDKSDDYTGLLEYMNSKDLGVGRHQSQHLPGCGLHAGLDVPSRSGGPREGAPCAQGLLRDRRRDGRSRR